jgi:hypothetical protein
VTRDGMPRAYLRIDPNIDQHPDPLAMVRAMCAAARQPERGRFREAVVLERAVGRTAYKGMVQRGDVVPLDQGIYLDGWDEWQEGDHTVGDRMRRMRARRTTKRHTTVSPVTPPPSPDRTGVTTDAVSLSSTSIGVKASDDSPPPQVGRRKDGTNPRAVGSNPRANGTSPRQEREAQKRGPSSLHQILTAIQKGDPA